LVSFTPLSCWALQFPLRVQVFGWLWKEVIVCGSEAHGIGSVVRAAALNNIAYLPESGEIIGGRSCYYKEECQRGCQSNGANMPRCSQRGALFDFMSIP